MKPTVEQQIEACLRAKRMVLPDNPLCAELDAAATTLRRYVALEAPVGEFLAAHKSTLREMRDTGRLSDEAMALQTVKLVALRSIHEQGKAE